MKLLLTLLLILNIYGCASTQSKSIIKEHNLLFQPLYSEVLSQNKGNILTPQSLKKNQLKGISEGFSFSRVNYDLKNEKNISSISYDKLIRVEEEKYYFISTTTNLKHDMEYMIKENITYIYIDGNYFNIGAGGCYFVIGYCEFSPKVGPKIKAETVFDNGLWITTYELFGKTRISFNIFDKFGLPLYSHEYSSSSSMFIASVRTK